MTKEQYSGVTRPRGILSASKDTLNPLLNAETLKNRLALIEHYKYQHGVQMAHWPHFALKRAATHLNRYKFNYGVKAFAAYIVYSDIANYRYENEKTFMTLQRQATHIAKTGAHLGAFTALCLFI